MPSIPWLRPSGLAVAVWCLPACAGDPDTVELRFGIFSDTLTRPRTAESAPSRRTALDTEPVFPTFRSDDGVLFTVESAIATLVDVRLELPDGRECADYKDALAPLMTCTDAAEGQPGTLTVKGPIDVDWMKATTLPDWPLRIPRGTYRHMNARFGQNTQALPSFSLEASFTWEDRRHLLRVAFPSTAGLSFEPRSPFDIDGASEDAIVVGGLDPLTWLDGVPVAACLKSGDLTLVGTTLRLETGKGACEGAAERVKHNIEASPKLSLATPR